MLKVLMIGGTGIISSDITALASQKNNIELYLLNRGNTPSFVPENVKCIQVDINDADAVREKIKGMTFDVVADFISYNVEALEHKLNLFEGITTQYVFISSVAAYRHIDHFYIINERNTPTGNPLWSYGLNKTLCENLLMEKCAAGRMNYTIVRPAYTYNNIRILHPYTINHWASWTMADRLLKGKPYVLHDDGQQLCTAMHASDFAKAFVGLWGNPAAMNEDFNITSSEYLTWKRIAEMTADALGVSPEFCFVPAEKIFLELNYSAGEKVMHTTGHDVYDNSKVRSAVPDFDCSTYFREGIKHTVNFYLEHPEFQKISEQWDRDFDRIVEKYHA
jgi:nucleoside-diphosphate-sugar epimerase